MFRSLRTGWVSLGCRKRRYDAGEFRWAAENADMMLGGFVGLQRTPISLWVKSRQVPKSRTQRFYCKEVAQSQPTSKRLSSLEAWLDSIEGAVGTYVGDFTMYSTPKIKTDDSQNAGQYTIM